MGNQYQPKKESDPRYLADTLEHIAQTFRPFKDKLANAFRNRIAMLKRKY